MCEKKHDPYQVSDEACAGCCYYGRLTSGKKGCCNYTYITGRIRPDEPCDQCSVKLIGKHVSRDWVGKNFDKKT